MKDYGGPFRPALLEAHTHGGSSSRPAGGRAGPSGVGGSAVNSSACSSRCPQVSDHVPHCMAMYCMANILQSLSSSLSSSSSSYSGAYIFIIIILVIVIIVIIIIKTLGQQLKPRKTAA